MKKGDFPSTLLDRFQIRLPEGMRDAIADLAKTNKRPMNAEIIAALESHLAASGVELPAQPKPYNARLDTFVAAAMTGLLARSVGDVDLANAVDIGRLMLDIMESQDAPR